jgi:hypothetical protein
MTKKPNISDIENRPKPYAIYHPNNGLYHCEDGPAFFGEMTTRWYMNGKMHRLDGPAIVWNEEYDRNFDQWWINGLEVTDEIYEWASERDIDLNNLTEEDKIVIALEWSGYKE